MAPRKKSEQETTTAVAKWSDRLAQFAQEAADTEASTISSPFISVRGGQLTFNDQVIPGNRVAVVILDYILENVFYNGPFTPDQPQSPLCFAYGRSEDDMAPHEMAVEPQHEQCKGCAQNAWGTADRGRGKACRNTRRLAMIAVNTWDDKGNPTAAYDDDTLSLAEHVQKTQIALLKLPVTSVKGYSGYVKQLNGVNLPPFAVITTVRLEPHTKDQFHVIFEPLEQLHKQEDVLDAIFGRRQEAEALLRQPYVPMEDEAPPPPQPTRGRSTTTATAKRGAPTAKRKY